MKQTIINACLAICVVALFILVFVFMPRTKKPAVQEVEAAGELLPIAIINTDSILQNYTLAVQMEPSNMEYRQALNMMQQRGGGYRPYGYTNTVDGLDCCTTLLCLNCLCGGGHC